MQPDQHTETAVQRTRGCARLTVRRRFAPDGERCCQALMLLLSAGNSTHDEVSSTGTAECDHDAQK
jgi:hypothetical protein